MNISQEKVFAIIGRLYLDYAATVEELAGTQRLLGATRAALVTATSPPAEPEEPEVPPSPIIS